jgi:hypothetical protein
MSKYAGNLITSGADLGTSVYFDGSGDWLVTGNAGSITGNFTLEFWTYQLLPSATWYPYVFGTNTPWQSTGGIGMAYDTQTTVTGSTAINMQIAGVGVSVGPFSAIRDRWVHFAVVRSGSTVTVYRDGVSMGTVANSATINTTTWMIGGVDEGGSYGNHPTLGYVYDFRLVKGTALYTSDFLPPTQLQKVANTALLTCRTTAFIDESDNNYSITPAGTPRFTAFTPHTGYKNYDPLSGGGQPGMWTLSEALDARQSRRWNMYDPDFQSVLFALRNTDLSGGQNNSFLDSSTSNFAITRGGNATQAALTPFSCPPNQWSAYFDLNNSSTTVPAINPGTVPLSLEFWMNWSGAIPDAGDANTVYVWTVGGKSSYGSVMQLTISNNASPPTINFRWGQSGNGGPYIEKVFPIRQGEWHHYLWTRNGTRATLYVDGVNVGNGTGYNSWGSASTAMEGTQYFNEPATNFYFNGAFHGYISNWRLISNQEIVSGDFTPSTNGLTATAIGHTGANVASSITGTVQELFFSTYVPWKDQSSNNRVPSSYITSVWASSISPFTVVNPYNPNVNGGSGYFDGSGDYLLCTASGITTAVNFGTQDFTISMWYYPVSFAVNRTLIDFRSANGPSFGSLYVTTGAAPVFYDGNTYTSTALVRVNSWNHIVFSRNTVGGTSTLRIFVNGQQGYSATNTSSFAGGKVTVGGHVDLNGSWLYGYLTDVNIEKNIGVASVTVPTSPAVRSANTSFLLSFTNGSVYDQCSKLALETLTSAQVYAPTTVDSNIKFGKSSVYFPGSPSYILGANSAAFNIGTCDFTIELWVKPSSVAAAQGLVGVSGGSGAVPKFVVHLGAGGTPSIHYNGLTNGSAIYTTATRAIAANVWSHLMFVRYNGNWYWFINGMPSGTGTNSTSLYFTTQPIYIGYGAEASFPYFTGYMSDIRLTRGVARRLANFTPPLSMSQNQ